MTTNPPPPDRFPYPLPARGPRVSSRGMAVFALIAANAIWGGSAAASKMVLIHVPPLTLACLRVVIAVGVLRVMLAVTGSRPTSGRAPATLGLTGVALFCGCQNLGLRYSTVSTTALLNGAIPVLTALLAVVFLSERLGRRLLAGLLVSFLGITILIWSELLVPGRPRRDGDSWNRPDHRARCRAGVLPWGRMLGGYGFARLEASFGAVFGNLKPLVGVALAVTLVGESLTSSQIGGSALVLLGVGIASQLPTIPGIASTMPTRSKWQQRQPRSVPQRLAMSRRESRTGRSEYRVATAASASGRIRFVVRITSRT